MQFVSRSVVIGFVNALAILIFMAQLPEFKGQGLLMYGMVAAGLAIIYMVPRCFQWVDARAGSSRNEERSSNRLFFSK